MRKRGFRAAKKCLAEQLWLEYFNQVLRGQGIIDQRTYRNMRFTIFVRGKEILRYEK